MTIELPNWRTSFQIESFPIVSIGDPPLLWMPISTLRPDRRMSTIAVMRRMSAWWSFSACDRRSTPLISRLGSACEWPVGEEQKKQKRKNRKNIESEESKKNAVRVSGRWIWAFCSKEEQKEEQIKKKRERKKSGEEKKKERKKEKREWSVGCDNALAFGAHNLYLFTDMPLCDGFWVLKIGFSCFHFPWLSSIFWITE